MKIGDKVRFLSTTGGGKIAGFQKGNNKGCGCRCSQGLMGIRRFSAGLY